MHHHQAYPFYGQKQYSQHKAQYSEAPKHLGPKSSSYSTGSLPYFHQLKQYQQQRHPSQDRSDPNLPSPFSNSSNKQSNKKDSVESEWPYMDAVETLNGAQKFNGRSSDGTSPVSKSSDSPTPNSLLSQKKHSTTPSLSDLPPTRNSIPPVCLNIIVRILRLIFSELCPAKSTRRREWRTRSTTHPRAPDEDPLNCESLK